SWQLYITEKVTSLRTWAVDTIGFLSYLYKERAGLRKMYDLQKIEAGNIQNVVRFLDRPNKEVRRLDALKARANAPKRVVGLPFAGHYSGPTEPPPQFRDHGE